MKKAISLFILSICLFSFAGCQDSAKKNSAGENSKDVSKFPKFLVGTWKAEEAETEECKWAFTFEPNGKISSMTHGMGDHIKMAEGGRYDRYPGDPNIEGAVILGPVEVNYVPQNRMFTIKVVTDYFMMHAYTEIIQGNSVDIISGTISSDGKFWDAELKDFSRLEEGPPLDFNNPIISNVKFYKVHSN